MIKFVQKNGDRIVDPIDKSKFVERANSFNERAARACIGVDTPVAVFVEDEEGDLKEVGVGFYVGEIGLSTTEEIQAAQEFLDHSASEDDQRRVVENMRSSEPKSFEEEDLKPIAQEQLLLHQFFRTTKPLVQIGDRTIHGTDDFKIVPVYELK